MTNKDFVFHCLDTKLLKEFLETCNEYVGYVKKPFSPIPLKSLWKCDQSDWGAAYKQWGILQFYVGVIAAIVFGIVHIVSDGTEYAGAAVVVEVLWRIVVAYALAHFSWFAVVRKNGCCWGILFCCECPPLLLLWGILGIVYGIFGCVTALVVLGACPVCIIWAACQLVYSIILLYMGLCCFKLWVQNGSEIVPPAVEVKGVEGQVIGEQKI